MSRYSVIVGDCRIVLAGMEPDSVDAIVTDPPYELGFMGKRWDKAGVAFDPATWAACLRVLKPGGRLLAFGAPRTSHRIWCAIEDAGFVIEDTAMWLFGSGFPKHRSKLKPAYEPVCIARKGPVSELNIDGCRIAGVVQKGAGSTGFGVRDDGYEHGTGREYTSAGRWPANVMLSHHDECEQVGTRKVRGSRIDKPCESDDMQAFAGGGLGGRRGSRGIGDADGTETVAVYECHPDCPVRLLDEQSGERPVSGAARLGGGGYNHAGKPGMFGVSGGDPATWPNDSGGASRFFYTAKASRSERNAGLDGMPQRNGGSNAKGFTDDVAAGNDRNRPVANDHPTVKPVELMRYLVRLVTPNGGTVLDPFCGSGSTGVACTMEGRDFIGIELSPEYAAIAERRIRQTQPTLFAG